MSVEVALQRRAAINRPGVNSQQRQPGNERRRRGGQGHWSAARRGKICPALAGKEDRPPRCAATLAAKPEAMMAAHGCRLAVVAPAYPAAGRHPGRALLCAWGGPPDQTGICQRSENAREPGGDSKLSPCRAVFPV